LPEFLAEARKYHPCLTLSHQYIDQLSLPVRQAVLNNVGTITAFCICHSDAEIMANQFGEEFPAKAFADPLISTAMRY
jgi:hypothetical protein